MNQTRTLTSQQLATLLKILDELHQVTRDLHRHIELMINESKPQPPPFIDNKEEPF